MSIKLLDYQFALSEQGFLWLLGRSKTIASQAKKQRERFAIAHTAKSLRGPVETVT